MIVLYICFPYAYPLQCLKNAQSEPTKVLTMTTLTGHLVFAGSVSMKSQSSKVPGENSSLTC